MSSGFLNGLYIVPVLAVLILVHEFGHFFSARMCGVKVEEFGIGIPPRVKGWKWKNVLWSVNAIPFGGFVRVKGEDGTNMEPDSMNAQPPHERAFFLAAGAAMNVILAVVLMIFVVGIEGVNHERVYVTVVQAGSPAAKAGWKAGDRLVEIAGKNVDGTDVVSSATRSHAGEAVTAVIERRGQLITTTLIPRKHPPEGEGPAGIGLDSRYIGKLIVEKVDPGSPAAAAGLQPGDVITAINNRQATDFFVLATELTRFEGFSVPFTYERDGVANRASLDVPGDVGTGDVFAAIGLPEMLQKPTPEKVPALKVIPRGFQEAYRTTVSMVRGIKQLFSSRDNLKQVAGPIGMGQLTSELVEQSPFPLWVTLANLGIILSLNLALLNLLPLPALDGGRLMFVLIEVVRGGKKIAPEKEGFVHFAGLVILIGFMFVVGFFDVNRLLDGRSFIP